MNPNPILALTLGIAAFLSANPTLHAQETMAMHYASASSEFGRRFLDLPAGAIGLVSTNGCAAEPSLAGSRVYLMENPIYWGVTDTCIRIVLNHRGPAAMNLPSYVGVQIVGFYADEQDSTVVLKREGTFIRSGRILRLMEDQLLTKGEMRIEDFDRIHGAPYAGPEDSARALSNFDARSGVEWHGTPEGGSHDSWDERQRFVSPKFQQINLKERVLENRLYRFIPYGVDSRPSTGPFKFDVRRKGALAIAIKVFSPVSSDYGGQFAIIFSRNRDQVAKLLNTQLAGRGFFGLF